MTDKPAYWQWQRHLLRNWHRPDLGKRENAALNGAILLAFAMATWSTDGNRIYTSAATAAETLGISERTAKSYRAIGLKYGFLRDTGETMGRVRVLCIALPPCAKGAEDCPSCAGYRAKDCPMIGQRTARNTREIQESTSPTEVGPSESSESLGDSSSSVSLADPKGGQSKGVPIGQRTARYDRQTDAPAHIDDGGYCPACNASVCKNRAARVLKEFRDKYGDADPWDDEPKATANNSYSL